MNLEKLLNCQDVLILICKMLPLKTINNLQSCNKKINKNLLNSKNEILIDKKDKNFFCGTVVKYINSKTRSWPSKNLYKIEKIEKTFRSGKLHSVDDKPCIKIITKICNLEKGENPLDLNLYDSFNFKNSKISIIETNIWKKNGKLYRKNLEPPIVYKYYCNNFQSDHITVTERWNPSDKRSKYHFISYYKNMIHISFIKSKNNCSLSTVISLNVGKFTICTHSTFFRNEEIGSINKKFDLDLLYLEKKHTEYMCVNIFHIY